MKVCPKSFHYFFWLGCLALTIIPLQACFVSAQEEEDVTLQAKELAVVAYVSWWSLDPTGYHPCIYLELENTSGKDLSGQLIRFQSMFVDRRYGDVVRAREEFRQSLGPRHRLKVALLADKAFQLPIDVNAWPRMDCKVMYRLGNAGDEGTRTLLITSLKNQTMTLEEAEQEISKIQPFSQTQLPSYYRGNQPAHGQPTAKPLAASALTLKSRLKQRSKPETIASVLSHTTMPGLGSDFYNFEKVFGLPASTDTKDPGWTWAIFHKTNPALSLYVGSKGQTGKVDAILLELPCLEVQSEAHLFSLAKCLAGNLRNERLGPPIRSVRYLQSGRSEFVSSSAQRLQIAFWTPRGNTIETNTYILLLSRLPQPIGEWFGQHTKLTSILHPLSKLLTSNP